MMEYMAILGQNPPTRPGIGPRLVVGAILSHYTIVIR